MLPARSRSPPERKGLKIKGQLLPLRNHWLQNALPTWQNSMRKTSENVSHVFWWFTVKYHHKSSIQNHEISYKNIILYNILYRILLPPPTPWSKNIFLNLGPTSVWALRYINFSAYAFFFGKREEADPRPLTISVIPLRNPPPPLKNTLPLNPNRKSRVYSGKVIISIIVLLWVDYLRNQ